VPAALIGDSVVGGIHRNSNSTPRQRSVNDCIFVPAAAASNMVVCAAEQNSNNHPSERASI